MLSGQRSVYKLSGGFLGPGGVFLKLGGGGCIGFLDWVETGGAWWRWKKTGWEWVEMSEGGWVVFYVIR